MWDWQYMLTDRLNPLTFTVCVSTHGWINHNMSFCTHYSFINKFLQPWIKMLQSELNTVFCRTSFVFTKRQRISEETWNQLKLNPPVKHLMKWKRQLLNRFCVLQLYSIPLSSSRCLSLFSHGRIDAGIHCRSNLIRLEYYSSPAQPRATFN